jgi:hypothetical protein
MASTAVVDKVVKTILQLWPPYRWEDGQEANWIAVLATKISGFSDQVIERMLSELIGKREDRRTPLPAEVIAGCIEAKRWLDVENGQKVLPTINADGLAIKHPEFADSRYRYADDLICGKHGRAELGRQAAKDGYWILQLHDYCRKQQKLPTDAEIPALKRAAQETDAVFAAFVPKDSWTSKIAVQAIETVAFNRNKLCDLVHGKWVRPTP